MQAKYPLKVQAIRTKGTTPRLYVYFPLPLAAAIGLKAGERVQWELLDRSEVHLVRLDTSAPSTRNEPLRSEHPNARKTSPMGGSFDEGGFAAESIFDIPSHARVLLFSSILFLTLAGSAFSALRKS